MKRLLTALLALCLLLTLAACGDTGDAADQGESEGTNAPAAEELPPTETVATLEVWTVSQERWDIAGEVIELEQAQLEAILSEEPLVLPEEQRLYAELRYGDTVVAYSGTEERPATATVVALWESRCHYSRITMADLQGALTSAKLEFPNGTPIYAAQSDLPRLQAMLTGAKPYGGSGACIFGATLTLAFDDGREITLAKGTDGCDSFTIGGYACYTVGESNNNAFWEMFGGWPK